MLSNEPRPQWGTTKADRLGATSGTSGARTAREIYSQRGKGAPKRGFRFARVVARTGCGRHANGPAHQSRDEIRNQRVLGDDIDGQPRNKIPDIGADELYVE